GRRGVTLIALTRAAAAAAPTPTLNTNIVPTIATRVARSAITKPRNEAAAATLTALATTTKRVKEKRLINRLARRLPSQIPETRRARYSPTLALGTCSRSIKMKGAQAMNAYKDVVAQAPPTA